MKINKTGIAARDSALQGAKYIAKNIKGTIGPYGANFLLEKGNKSTNDGYIISQELILSIENEFERRGAIIAGEASAKTNDQVGDATSTSWALTDAITDEAVRYLPSEKSSIAKKTPAEIKNMINTSKDNVILKLKDMAIPVFDKETLVKSALVSVEDETLAVLLGETQFQLGPEGIIIAEEANETVSSIEIVKGIRIDNGWSTQSVITNPEKGTLELQNTAVILTNYTLGIEELKAMQESIFKPLINQKQTKLAIMARAFTSEAIKWAIDLGQSGFALIPINAPYTDQQEIMKDLEALLGGRYIDQEEASLSDLYITDVGHAKSLTAGRFDAIITGTDDERAQERIQKRVEVLKAKLEGAQSDFLRKMIETRIAQFTSGFAILKVGAISPGERKRLKDKADDAVNAVRYALKGGTVPGAGLAFKQIAETLEDTDILKRPLSVIYEQIVGSAPEGFIIEEWVRDPYLVLKVALENACEVSGNLCNIGGMVVEENPKRKKDEDTD